MIQFTRCTSCAERQAHNVDVEASLCPGCRANKAAIDELARTVVALKQGRVVDGDLSVEQMAEIVQKMQDAASEVIASLGGVDRPDRELDVPPALHTSSPALLWLRDAVLASLRTNLAACAVSGATARGPLEEPITVHYAEGAMIFCANNIAQSLAPVAQLVDLALEWRLAMQALRDQVMPVASDQTAIAAYYDVRVALAGIACAKRNELIEETAFVAALIQPTIPKRPVS